MKSFVKPFPNKPRLQDKSFENAVGKGEIARDEQFLLFPQCFLLMLENILPFSSNSKSTSRNSKRTDVQQIGYDI